MSADSNNPFGSSLEPAQNGGSSEPGHCVVNVTFAASGSGITTGTLNIPSSAPGATTNVILVGSTGGNSVALTPTASPSSLSFGNVTVGTTSTAQTATLSNPTGAASASVSIAVSGGYSQTNNCGSTLAGGASCAISVKFSPPTTGIVSGTLTITASTSNSPITVALSGTGTGAPTVPTIPTGLSAAPAGSGTINLSWTASSGTAPITYNVYRGTSSGGEGATPIATGITATTYADGTVTNGTTYYYKVSATNSIGTSNESGEASATPANTGGALVQINAGGQGVSSFVADKYFNNGNEFTTATTVTTAGAINAAPEAVCQSVRYAPSFAYTIPRLAPDSTYTVRLHFAELTFTGSGQRVFNVAINGTTVLPNFDVFATAGLDKALVEQFTTTADVLGQITISFMKGLADNPEISGIEVLGSGTLGTPLSDVLEIDTGSSVAVPPFAADEDFNTGNKASSSAAIATGNTSSPAPAAVYQTCRWASSFTYATPGLSANKTYAVRLHFAELTFAGPGERVFNVAINGTPVLSNFDINATSGAMNRALTEQFNAVADQTGKIVIAFTTGPTDNPEVNAIEILH